MHLTGLCLSYILSVYLLKSLQQLVNAFDLQMWYDCLLLGLYNGVARMGAIAVLRRRSAYEWLCCRFALGSQRRTP